MRITVITAFPDFFKAFLSTSIVGRAVERGLLDVSVIDLREYGEGEYRKVDDYAFGGSGGMVLMAEPLARAVEDLGDDGFVVYPSPQGVPLTQETVESLATKGHVVIVCGHYEGVDERFTQSHVDMELSIGDYVLTGGELPAMVLIDSVSRLVPGVVGKGRAVVEDSFYRGMLDTPHFTRPSSWRGEAVPDVLLSGNDGAVGAWRRNEAVSRTLERRPDLLSRANVLPYLEKGCYVLWRPEGDPSAMELDLLVQGCRGYGIPRLLVTISDPERREACRTIVRETSSLDGSVKLFPSEKRARQWIEEREKAEPFGIGMGREAGDELRSWLELKREILRCERPILFLFGEDVRIDEGDATMRPVAGDDRLRSALPVQNVVSVVLDRFFGWR